MCVFSFLSSQWNLLWFWLHYDSFYWEFNFWHFCYWEFHFLHFCYLWSGFHVLFKFFKLFANFQNWVILLFWLQFRICLTHFLHSLLNDCFINILHVTFISIFVDYDSVTLFWWVWSFLLLFNLRQIIIHLDNLKNLFT